MRFRVIAHEPYNKSSTWVVIEPTKPSARGRRRGWWLKDEDEVKRLPVGTVFRFIPGSGGQYVVLKGAVSPHRSKNRYNH